MNKILFVSFVGGFAAGALGLGGGSIYNPALMALGVSPKVSGCTGMYLVFWSALNSSIVNYMEGYLNIPYASFIGAWVVFGSIGGNIAADYYVKKKGGKQTIFVWLLAVVFLICAGVTPFVAFDQLSKDMENGKSIIGF